MRWIVIVVFIGILGCVDGGDKRPSLTIATSANMQFAMNAIAKSFSNKTGYKTNIILGSSGKLTAQILEGAPYDIFVSADMKYPKMIYQNGLSIDPPTVYALGQLVLWTTYLNELPKLNELARLHIDHIAIANPVTAPYGQAAVEVLQNIGLYDMLQDKLVFGESIAQTNQFIDTGVAELGFTSKSVVLSPHGKDRGRWEAIPAQYYTPISQGAIVINRNQVNMDQIKAFYAYLFSPEAMVILKDFGYLVNE